MKLQDNTTLTYVAPKVETVTITTCFRILSGSVTPYEYGSSSDNNGYGYDMD